MIKRFLIALLAFSSLAFSAQAYALNPTAEPASSISKTDVLAEQTYRRDVVGYIEDGMHAAFQHEVVEPMLATVPEVSGNEELDAQLKLILENVVGTDEDALLRAYEWVGSEDNFAYLDMDYVSQDDAWQDWSVPCALQMIHMKTGNCYRYASLLCWIARALGYDARAVNGYIYMSSGWLLHGWVEIDLNGQTYIIDPQQHAREINEGVNLFMVTYEDAPFYYETLEEWNQ